MKPTWVLNDEERRERIVKKKANAAKKSTEVEDPEPKGKDGSIDSNPNMFGSVHFLRFGSSIFG